MFRGLVFFVILLFLLPLLLPAVRALFRLADSLMSGGGSNPQAADPRASVPRSGELKKDPVCGTYVSESSEYRTTLHGKTVYFCSESCLRRYEG
jgi:YHS domain-containing protein